MRYNVEDIAQVCWEHNRALQAADRELWPDEPWIAAPEWRREILLAMILLVQDNLLRSAHDTHDYWVFQMRKAGWEPGEKDLVRRRHPSLLPWFQLADWQRLAQQFNYDTIMRMSAVG